MRNNAGVVYDLIFSAAIIFIPYGLLLIAFGSR